MSKGSLTRLTLLLLMLLLTGCQIDLYKALSEQKANQMLALLMINQVAAKKVQETGGSIKLTVEERDFVNAVEVLRQHGYPKRHYHSVNDLFPAGQLVTSPAQELSKISYLKEQHLEQMLTSMEGVVSASVAIAEPPPAQNRREVVRPSAAVLVKHSPESNMNHFINQIKSLVHNSVPGLNYDAITVVLQPTNYRFVTPPLLAATIHSAPAPASASVAAAANPAQRPVVPAKDALPVPTFSLQDPMGSLIEGVIWLCQAHGMLLLNGVWLLIVGGLLLKYLLGRSTLRRAEQDD